MKDLSHLSRMNRSHRVAWLEFQEGVMVTEQTSLGFVFPALMAIGLLLVWAVS
jgi:hypothetical protein